MGVEGRVPALVHPAHPLWQQPIQAHRHHDSGDADVAVAHDLEGIERESETDEQDDQRTGGQCHGQHARGKDNGPGDFRRRIHVPIPIGGHDLTFRAGGMLKSDAEKRQQESRHDEGPHHDEGLVPERARFLDFTILLGRVRRPLQALPGHGCDQERQEPAEARRRVHARALEPLPTRPGRRWRTRPLPRQTRSICRRRRSAGVASRTPTVSTKPMMMPQKITCWNRT